MFQLFSFFKCTFKQSHCLSSHLSSLCRTSTSGPSQSQRWWSTTAGRHCVRQRYRTGRSSPCGRKGRRRAGLPSFHRKPEPVHLHENMRTRFSRAPPPPEPIVPTRASQGGFSKALTPLITAYPVPKAGADHLPRSLVLEPALSNEVRQAAVSRTGSLLGGLRQTDGLDVGDDARATPYVVKKSELITQNDGNDGPALPRPTVVYSIYQKWVQRESTP